MSAYPKTEGRFPAVSGVRFAFDPSLPAGKLWFCSDEHVTFAPPADAKVAVGDRLRLAPAHVDPTVAYHEWIHVVSGETVLDSWAVDLRGW